ncbi:MAG: hypothetical protein LUE29_00355 [Lachnospiraceae bacterium]|nr:hypothetical protein [Lachnospiraceae bacterium]
MSKVIEDMIEETDYKARARVVVSLWTNGIKDVSRIAKITEFSTDQVINILGSRYAEA